MPDSIGIATLILTSLVMLGQGATLVLLYNMQKETSQPEAPVVQRGPRWNPGNLLNPISVDEQQVYSEETRRKILTLMEEE